jgi:hypothetical protein
MGTGRVLANTVKSHDNARLIIRNKCWDPSSTADTIGTCLLDETAHTTGDPRFMPSVGIQEQPKFREIFRRLNWNRFWNREPLYLEPQAGEDEKTL